MAAVLQRFQAPTCSWTAIARSLADTAVMAEPALLTSQMSAPLKVHPEEVVVARAVMGQTFSRDLPRFSQAPLSTVVREETAETAAPTGVALVQAVTVALVFTSWVFPPSITREALLVAPADLEGIGIMRTTVSKATGPQAQVALACSRTVATRSLTQAQLPVV
ncbi:hypothetical protein HUS71_09330 [Pandoraea nosoerga]|nr:hypothetical protein [Pandoraea nosoerga]